MTEKTKRRLISITNWGTDEVFEGLFTQVLTDIPNDFNSNDCILLEGGVDIDPELYGQKRIGYTQHPSRMRDKEEVALYRAAVLAGAGIIGICRGAQLITALQPEGKLIQHVTGHGAAGSSGHWIACDDGRVMWATSLHHQMMWPFDLKPESYKMIAWTQKILSSEFLTDKGDITTSLPFDFKEPEIVWYPGVRGLAIQGHPEYMPRGANYRDYCVELAWRFITNAEAV